MRLVLKNKTTTPAVIALLLMLNACSNTIHSNVRQPALTAANQNLLTGELITVPAGTFIMGDDHSTQPDERPAHKVQLAGFRVARAEVKRQQYQQFIADTGYNTISPCWGWEGSVQITKAHWTWRNPGFSQDDTHPVVCVSWNDAQAFLAWLNKKLSPEKPYRLLTEAEWEYVARAGKHTTYPWDDFPIDNIANCWVCNDAFKNTSPAGSFSSNIWGIQDLSGNAWEWVQDCYSMNYVNTPANGTAQQSPPCPSRVVRGGSWADKVGFLRSAYRLPYLAGYRNHAVGFRIAQDL